MIRLAQDNEADRILFRRLWMAFLEEMDRNFQSEIRATEANVDAFEKIMRTYVSGERKGVVLFSDTHAVMMWGDPGNAFETTWDPYFYGWGTYIEPEHRSRGLLKPLREAMMAHSRSLGVHAIVGAVHSGNERSRHGLLALGGVPLDFQVGILRF